MWVLKDFKQFQTILHLDGSFCVEEYCDTGGKGTDHRETSDIAKKKIFQDIKMNYYLQNRKLNLQKTSYQK